MATLQKLRNAGPLLIIFVGLALLAFIAGDAFRIFQSPQGSQSVGSVNGKEITAAEFQKLYEEQSNVLKFVRGTNTLSENDLNGVKDATWQNHFRNILIQNETDKLGLTVTDAELQAIVAKGEHYLLANTPFVNAQKKFDINILNEFLTQYNQYKDTEYMEQLRPAYDYWKFMEKTIKQEILTEKYGSLIEKSFISNPVAAQYSFDAGNVTYDIELIKYPYTAIADADITVTDADKKAVYEDEKGKFRNYEESRDIKYVSVRVVPNAKDRAELVKEMTEYADSLSTSTDYANIVRIANSEVPYSQLAWSKEIFPEEVQLRIDSMKENTMEGPIRNAYDNSYTVFKFIGKETIADSVLCRILPVNADNAERTAFITDSLLTELKKGANFKELAAKYGQENNDSIWLTWAMYERATTISDDDVAFVTALFNGKKGEYAVFSPENTPNKIIYQVLDKKNPETKYHAAVIKRTVEFSTDTYNAAYDKFSQFVASCKTVEDIEKNAEENGYRVRTSDIRQPLTTASHNIAGIPGTHEAVRWLFNEAKVGNVSPLYECGNNDNLLVIALTGINEKGYSTMERIDSIYTVSGLPGITEKAAINKKAEKIMAEIKGKSFNEVASIGAVKSDTVKHVSFSAPANIDKISEPAISAAVTKLQPGKESAPIKGNAGVYVIRLIAKNNAKTEFKADAEQDKLKNMGIRNAQFIITDLMEKGEIVDNRYLYF